MVAKHLHMLMPGATKTHGLPLPGEEQPLQDVETLGRHECPARPSVACQWFSFNPLHYCYHAVTPSPFILFKREENIDFKLAWYAKTIHVFKHLV